MMLGLTTCMSTPVASISLTRSGSSVIRLNNGSGTPPSTATPRAYCERSKVRFTTSGTRRWACTSMTIGLGAGPLETFAALRLALYDFERVRRRDGRAACLRRLIAVGIRPPEYYGTGSWAEQSPTPRIMGGLLRWNDGHQEEGFLVAAGIDRVLPDIVVRVVVRVRGAADAVARLDVEADAMAFFEHHRGRPNLHLHLDDFVRLEPQSAQVLVIGPIGKRQFRIELAMRDPQPALRHRHRLPLLSDLQHVVSVGVDVAQGEK